MGELYAKFGLTLFLLGALSVVVGIAVDAAKGFNSRWGRLVDFGMGSILASAGMGGILLLAMLWLNV